jgi:hypothetical protein
MRLDPGTDGEYVAYGDILEWTLPSPTYLGFTARTGGAHNNHFVKNIRMGEVTAGGSNTLVNLVTGLPNEDCVWDDCKDAETCGDAPETPAGMSAGYGKSPHAEGGCRSCTGDDMKMNGIRRCGNTAQSTMGWGSPDTPATSHGEPGVAIDGDPNSDWGGGSCTHTDLAPAWWQVNLGTRATVTKVNVWHRTNCCQDRLETAQIYVSDTPDFGNGRPCSPLSDSSNNPESTTCAGDGGTSLLHAFYSYFFILGILVFYECVFHE